MDKKITEITRRQLGSIDLDVDFWRKNKEPVGEDRKNWLGTQTAFFRDFLKEDLDYMLNEQLKFIATDASNQDMSNFARGTFNGILLVYETFKGRESEFKALVDDKESKPDKDDDSLFPTNL